MKVIAVTGYKPFELGIFKNDHPGVECIKKALHRKLTNFVEDGLEWVII
ncbi:SLOG family protein, partial [Bacillus tropicus]